MRWAPLMIVALGAGTVTAAADEPKGGEDLQARAAAVEKLDDAIGRVELTLKYDRSEEPSGAGWMERCPSCGQYHVSGATNVIAEERPAERAGYLIGPTTVVTADPLMHPRFIDSIAVRFGDEVVPARPAAYALRGNAMLLELEKPLPGAAPLNFDPQRPAPYFAASWALVNGVWTSAVQPLSGAVSLDETGRRFIAASPLALVIDKDGVPVGICLNDELPIDGSWKTSPQQWEKVTNNEMASMLQRFEQQASHALPRVTVNFRSPKSSDRMSDYYYRDPGEATATEWHGSSVLLDENTVLILAGLKPDVTARIDRIRIFPPDGDPVTATFHGTLKDYNGFIAKLEQPVTGAAVLADRDILDFRHDMLLAADIRVQGDSQAAYYTHTRIAAFDIGWKRHVYPQLAGQPQFLFSTNGELVAMPLGRREKVTVENEWGGRDENMLIPSQHLLAVTADLDAHFDSNNVPLSEEEESRIAWMGVELQDLDPELARANNVSELTQDGATGALVTWIYDGSPAHEAGIEPGDILLRLHIPGHPKPLDITGDSESMFGSMGFPWDRLDEVPEEYFDQIPTPWPSADNDLNQKLTRIGFGAECQAELARSGETLMLPLTIVQSPPHYDSAARHKNDVLGLTVRDLTFEVQRYLQRRPDDPGVIVSKIEPGSRASIAGLKPYELVTHVNDQPVMAVADFESLVKPGGELRLSVKRMTRGRIVKIDTDAAVEEQEVDQADADVEIDIELDPDVPLDDEADGELEGAGEDIEEAGALIGKPG